MKTIYTGKVTAYMPTREDLLNLKVGDIAPSSCGDRAVVEITARQDDIHGRAFVCYYVEFGPNARLSHSLKEDEIDRVISSPHNSAEWDYIEHRARPEHDQKTCRYWHALQSSESAQRGWIR